MFNPIHQLVSALPARPRRTLERFVPSMKEAKEAKQGPETPPRRNWRPTDLWERWFDVLGPDIDLSDLEIDDADLDRDLRRRRR